MLHIETPSIELWDEASETFVSTAAKSLDMEHSLVSMSKWESEWEKPFLSGNQLTAEENLSYIACMCLDSDVKPADLKWLSRSNLDEITRYINRPMSATKTKAKKDGSSRRRSSMTAEIIYAIMIEQHIPFECQYWHLNRLLTLIDVCQKRSAPPEKMSKADLMSRNAALNAARRQKLNSKG